MRTYSYISSSAVLSLIFSSTVFAFDPWSIVDGEFLIQGGGFISSVHETQDIEIETLRGNHYTVIDGDDGNGLVGLGYYFDIYDTESFGLDLGVNAFYLFDIDVSGNIIQEHLYPNLGYEYTIRNLPVYAVLKGSYENEIAEPFALTFDVGIGPNFIETSNYQEYSLDDGVTIPDDAFSGKSSTTLSATAGFGFRLNEIFDAFDMELGYRFFYLGEGEFHKHNSQVENNLETGSIYANALILSLVI